MNGSSQEVSLTAASFSSCANNLKHGSSDICWFVCPFTQGSSGQGEGERRHLRQHMHALFGQARDEFSDLLVALVAGRVHGLLHGRCPHLVNISEWQD